MVPVLRKIAVITAAMLFVIAGALHFRWPDTYVKIVPPLIPEPRAMVYISGAAEIAGGFGLLLPRVRRLAAWGLVALLIAVFPANIYMALDRVQITTNPLSPWVLWSRLPLQFLLIWWILSCTKGSASTPGVSQPMTSRNTIEQRNL